LTLIQAILVIVLIAGGFLAYSRWEYHKRAAPFIAAAEDALDEAYKLRAAVDAGAGYDAFVEHLASFKFKNDKLPSAYDLPDEAQKFRDQIDAVERKYDRAQRLWEQKFKYPLLYEEQLAKNPLAVEIALTEAGMSIGEAGFQLANLKRK
jgi:hypothetical protein